MRDCLIYYVMDGHFKVRTSSRHPSVNLTMNCARGVVLSLAAAAESLILAWQSLPQLLQTYGEGADTGVGAATRNFLL